MPVLINASRRHPFALLAMLLAFSLGYYFISSVDTQALNKEAPSQASAANNSNVTHSYSKAGSYLAARFARQDAKQQDAARLMSEALAHDPRNLDLRRDTIRQLIIAGEAAEAMEQVNKIPAMVHTHPLTRLVMLTHYIEEGEAEKASALLKAHKTEGILGLLEPVAQQWLALEMDDKTLLPMTLSQLEKKQTGYAERLLSYHMGLLNHAADYNKIAHEQLQASTADIKAIPARMVYSYINFLRQTGEDTLAKATIARYHQQFSQSHHIPTSLDEWGQYVEAHTLPKTTKEGVAEILFSVGNVLFSANNREETQFYLQLSLFLRPDFAPAQTLLARVAESYGEYDHALDLYRAIHPESIYAHQAAREMVINHYQKGALLEAQEAFDQLRERFAVNEKDWFAYGNMLRSEEKFEKAVVAYSEAIALTEAQKKEMWQLYFARGAAYERNGEWEEAERDLTHALSLDGNQPDVLNYLGYSWAEQGSDLAKAREYVARALRMAPNAGHIVDSMGWIEYRLGKFELAVKYLEHAAVLTPNDPTVNDHLGDALYRVGRIEEAKFQWNRALSFKPDEALEVKIQEKLASGLPEFVAPILKEASKAAQAESENAEPAVIQ